MYLSQAKLYVRINNAARLSRTTGTPPLKVKNIQLHASLKLFAGTISNLGAVTQWCLCCMHIFQNIKKFP